MKSRLFVTAFLFSQSDSHVPDFVSLTMKRLASSGKMTHEITSKATSTASEIFWMRRARRRHSSNALSNLRGKHFPRKSVNPSHGYMTRAILPRHHNSGINVILLSKSIFPPRYMALIDYFLYRALERPIVHRYQEIEAFPQALNISQMWNWSTRLFLTEARQNLTREAEADEPSKWTKEELDSLEKTLKEHETWLHIWVEKQKSVKMNEDPVIETTEMKARAKTLELHLQRLVRRKVPKARKTTTSATETPTSTAEETSSTPAVEPEPTSASPPPPEKDIRDEL